MPQYRKALIKSLNGLQFLSKAGREVLVVGWICKTVQNLSVTLRDKMLASDKRKQCLKELFDLTGSVAVIQGTDHLQGTKSAPFLLLPNEYTYPSDLKATAALNHWVFPEIRSLVEEPRDPGYTDSLICLGSPVNNRVARKYLGHPNKPNRVIETPYYRAELHFNHVAPSSKEIVLNWQAGRDEPWPERNWYIMSKEGRDFIPRPDEKGVLRIDYLLITRIPREMPSSIKSVLLIGGTHGAGTQGLELVLKQIDITKLEEMLNKMEHGLYYQALFRLYEISEKPSGKLFPSKPEFSIYRKGTESFHSVADQIELVDVRPLRIES